MAKSPQAPRHVRWLTGPERDILTDVFGNTLPFFQRIWITDALGAGGIPFTIPTSAVTAVGMMTPGTLITLAATKNPAAAAVVATITGTAAYVGSSMNVGYLINVGTGPYPDMSRDANYQALLVHEACHAWQGRNSVFALSYVVSSVVAQCGGIQRGGGFADREAAYNARPGDPWDSYNPEQQAQMVELWFVGGKKEDSPFFRYIRDNIRKGRNR